MKKTILLIMLIMSASQALAENETKDVSIEIIIENVTTSTEYTSLFKLTNKDYVRGGDNEVMVTVNYYLTNENTTFTNESFTKTFSQYATADTGRLYLTMNGTYELCGNITNSSRQDNVTENNYACKTINVTGLNEEIIEFPEEENSSCNISLTLTTDKTIYEDGETAKIKHEITGEGSYEIEYWVEDLYGNIVKKEVTTTNTNQKSYTPTTELQEQVFIIKSRIASSECEYEESTLEEIIIMKKEAVAREPEIKIEKVYLGNDKEAKFGDAIQAQISGFYEGKIKAWIEGEEKISEITELTANGEFTMKIPLQIKPNCDYETDNGTYDIVIEAGELSDSEEIEIEGLNKETCKTTIVEKIINKTYCPEKPSIESLYTRAKKYSENITIYSRTKGAGKMILTGTDIEMEKEGEGTMEWEIKPLKGENVLYLELYDGEELASTKKLEFYLEYEEKKEAMIETRNEKTTDEVTGAVTKIPVKNMSMPIIAGVTLIGLGVIMRVYKKKGKKAKFITNNRTNK